MLGLDGFEVLSVVEGPDELVVTVETAAVLVACSECGCRAESQDRMPIEIRDLQCFGRPVRLVWVKRRSRPSISSSVHLARTAGSVLLATRASTRRGSVLLPWRGVAPTTAPSSTPTSRVPPLPLARHATASTSSESLIDPPLNSMVKVSPSVRRRRSSAGSTHRVYAKFCAYCRLCESPQSYAFRGYKSLARRLARCFVMVRP